MSGTRDADEIDIIVDCDRSYQAKTTRKALELLLASHRHAGCHLMVEQTMGVPVGYGFGASAAAAISGVYASAAAMGLRLRKSDLAYHAHVADILEQTGLGTVSVTFEATGAGAITKAGGPGLARFLKVRVPKGTRLVTASLAPFKKKDALSQPRISRRINELGDAALSRVVSDPTLKTLAAEGERFSEELGLMSTEDESLIGLAKSTGATHASQNMIGHAIHALVAKEKARKVARALGESPNRPRVDTFEIGTECAHVLRGRSPG